MGKKVIGTIIVLGAAAAGAWHYVAQQFDEQAQGFIARLDSYKPYVSYGKIHIDKYRFQIHLSDFSLGTPPNTSPSTIETASKDVRFTFKNQLSFFYNPISKSLTIYNDDAANPSAAYVLQHGTKTTTIRPMIEGKPASDTITFHEHPIIKDTQFIDILKNIKQITSSVGKIKYLNADTNKEVLSCDDINYSLEMHLPNHGNSDQGYDVHLKTNYQNLIMTEDFSTMINGILTSMSVDPVMVTQFTNYLSPSLNYPLSSKSTLKFTSPKEEMDVLIAHIKEGKMSVGPEVISVIPSMKVDADGAGNSQYGKEMGSFNVDYKKSDGDAKIALSLDLTASDKLRPLIAKTIMNEFKQQNPTLTISEQDVIEMVPDVVAMSPLKLDLLVDMSLKTGVNIRDLRFLLSTKDYQTTLSGKVNIPAVNGSLEIQNYTGLKTDLMAYLDRVAQKGHGLEGLLTAVASLKVLIMTADHVITQIAPPTGDKNTVTLTGAYNMATAEASINGKPMAEIMTMIAPPPPAAVQAPTPGQPMMPGLPEMPVNPLQPDQVQPAMPAQPQQVQPVQPAMPVEPVTPVQPQPVQPAMPVEPVTPVQPQPVQPAMPAQPGEGMPQAQ